MIEHTQALTILEAFDNLAELTQEQSITEDRSSVQAKGRVRVEFAPNKALARRRIDVLRSSHGVIDVIPVWAGLEHAVVSDDGAQDCDRGTQSRGFVLIFGER